MSNSDEVLVPCDDWSLERQIELLERVVARDKAMMGLQIKSNYRSQFAQDSTKSPSRHFPKR